MPIRTSAFTEWLENQLTINRPGHHFPPDRELAEQFGLSPISIHRIMYRYAQDGRLERIPGKGTFIPSHDEPPQFPVGDAPLSSVDTLVNAVRDAIARGDFRKGTALPQMKFITLRYEVSYRTAIDAFRKLMELGLIHQVGKRYWVGSPKDTLRMPVNRDMYLLTTGTDDFAHPYQTAMGFAYQKLEKELHENGFQVHYANAHQIPALARQWSDQGMPAGLIIAGLRAADSRQLYADVNRHLPKIPTERPPLLLDLRGTHYHGEIGRVHRLTRGHLLTVSSRAMTDLINQKSFRQVVIFSNAQYYAWSFPGPAFPLYRVPWIARDLGCTARFRMVLRPLTEQLDEKGTFLDIHIQRSVKNYSARQYRPDEETYADVLLQDTAVVRDFSAVFSRFHGPGTLWAFNADADAITALEWARKQKIRVPDELSIIGLEHDPRFYHWGLSYCGPDWEKIGYQMAHAVIGDVPVARTGRGFIRTEAVVIEKLTTG